MCLIALHFVFVQPFPACYSPFVQVICVSCTLFGWAIIVWTSNSCVIYTCSFLASLVIRTCISCTNHWTTQLLPCQMSCTTQFYGQFTGNLCSQALATPLQWVSFCPLISPLKVCFHGILVSNSTHYCSFCVYFALISLILPHFTVISHSFHTFVRHFSASPRFARRCTTITRNCVQRVLLCVICTTTRILSHKICILSPE